MTRARRKGDVLLDRRGDMGSRVVSLLAAGCLLFDACGRKSPVPAGTPFERVGIWQIAVASSPDPARVGDNTFVIAARDSTGRPMRGSIEAIVSMPAMGTMPYMESRAKVKPAGGGTWRAEYGLSMSGEWDVSIRLHPEQGPPAEAQYRLSTSLEGVAFASGTAPPHAMRSTGMPPRADSSAGAVVIDPTRRQALGIRTDSVRVRDLDASVRVPGRVAFDEARQTEITMKFGGYVRDLTANVTGGPVQRGEMLFTAYSPELWSAQREYLDALRAAAVDHSNPGLGGASADLALAARARLELWDLSPADIDAIATSDEPRAAFPVRSPVSGVVTEKSVVAGSAFMAGQVLFRIAQLDPIWVIASVQQSDLGFVRAGMEAKIHDPYADGGVRHGKVAYVYPTLDSGTRSGEVRISVANPGGHLQAGTFVDAELIAPRLRRLAVPESAVLPTGERHLVFVDLGDGRLSPREVRLGQRANGYYEVLSGLQAGDMVVTSGNFLVGAESKLRSAAQKW
jgi:Cu(I)/Ag(I) efflux system membrane fusion protein